MVNNTAFTVIKLGSRMRMLAQSQKRAPRLNARTFQGSHEPRLVSRAPRIVNPVPSHFSVSVLIIIQLLYDLCAKLSTKKILPVLQCDRCVEFRCGDPSLGHVDVYELITEICPPTEAAVEGELQSGLLHVFQEHFHHWSGLFGHRFAP